VMNPTDLLAAKAALDPGVLDGAEDRAPANGTEGRRLRATLASDIAPARCHWLYEGRIPLDALTLIAGREGVGKSTVSYDLVARVTRGTLPGEHYRAPKMVIVVATEDSWAHTIVPRLLGVGADLTKVVKVDALCGEFESELDLPVDIDALKDVIRDHDAVLVLLDPIMSRIAAKLDTHRDADVRLALEPLVKMADATGAAVVGLIHVNKSGSDDVMNSLMGSRAFGAVARSVMVVTRDPDDDDVRLFGQAKNNLGPLAETLTFRIVGATVNTADGPAPTSKVEWIGTDARTIREIAAEATQDSETRTAVADAIEWVRDALLQNGGRRAYSTLKDEAKHAGYSESAIQRASRKLNVIKERAREYQAPTFWILPGSEGAVKSASEVSPGETSITDMTDVSTPSGPQSRQSRQSRQSYGVPTRDDSTDQTHPLRPDEPPPPGPSYLRQPTSAPWRDEHAQH
jgi:hypothetical protein